MINTALRRNSQTNFHNKEGAGKEGSQLRLPYTTLIQKNLIQIKKELNECLRVNSVATQQNSTSKTGKYMNMNNNRTASLTSKGQR